ncbi:molybdopterin-dependent oxidoreductase [Amaricoccus solimangrovi]|nr:molybdopterin-dependent oxidoreductase [Amaricoccus solimangrovi]
MALAVALGLGLAGGLAGPGPVLAREAETAALTASPGESGAETSLSLAELRAMPWTTVSTRNLYNDGVVAYAGPLMRDVLARLGLDGADSVICVALNDYEVEIPTADFRDWDVILAMEADGAPLSPRETGPLWIIYPQTDHPELDAPIYNQRLIWQLIRIEAR